MSRRSPLRSMAAHLALSGGVLLASLAIPSSLPAQEEARVRLTGQVVRDGGPVSDATVVLHRVTPDTAGEVDSVRVSASGEFALDLPSVPDPGGRGEVYFASVEHQGITYFGRAVHRAADLDSAYVIQVSDTAVVAEGGADLPVTMRHVILEEDADGWVVTELFQVVNEGSRTLVAREGGATWIHPLPEGAADVEIGGDQVPAGEAVADDGRYRVTAAIPPGERQFLVRYRMTEPDFTLPAPGRTRQMELLVREPAPPLDVAGLVAAETVEMQPGTSFRRYVGTGLSGGGIVITPGEGDERPFSVRWLAVVLALLLTTVGIWAVMRPGSRRALAGPAGRAPGSPTQGPGGASPAAATPAERRRVLMVEVARIDEALDVGELSERDTRALRERRAGLVERLRELS